MPDDLDPVDPPAITQAQLDAANAATAAQALELARVRATQKFPSVTEDLLSHITDPATVEAYAEQLHTHINRIAAATVSAPVADPAVDPAAPAPVPTPLPGPGGNPLAGDVDAAREEELLEAVLDKRATRGTPLNGRPKASEAVELFNLSMQRGFKDLAAAKR